LNIFTFKYNILLKKIINIHNGHRIVSFQKNKYNYLYQSNFLFKILLLGDSGVGKSCIILQFTENNFSNNLMNSIGVDFKLKSLEVDGKIVKLQIVS
jgi:GTPase SAR1 family protein